MIMEEERINQQSKLPRPRCFVYEPLSNEEGKCYDGAIVNINGCNHPESCIRYQNARSKNA